MICSKKIKSTLIITFCFFIQQDWNILAQQLPLYSQYFNNQFIYNPAFTGFSERPRVFVMHKSQWTDMPGAPIVSALTLDGPVKKDKIGLGFGVANQVWGISTRTSGFVSYSYKAEIDETKALKFGIAAGVIDSRIDFSKAVVKTASDPYIFGRNQRKTALDLNPGAAFSWSDFEMGFSVPQVLNNPVRYVNSDDQNSLFTFSRHYLASVKYSVFIKREENSYIMPYLLMRAVSLSTLQYDANVICNWKDIFWVSASYRSDYAVGLGAGFRINKNLGIGYSYDLITSPVSSYAGMSHEFVVSYAFGGKNDEAEKKELERDQEMKDMKKNLAQHEEKTDKLVKENELELLKATTKAEKLRRDMEALKKAMNDSLARLNKKIAEIPPPPPVVVQPEPTPVVVVQPEPTPVVVEQPKPKQDDEIKTSSQKNYKTNKGTELSKGFYIIIGSYKSKENAERFKRDNISKGYRECEIVYNNLNQYTYVYLSNHSTREEAIAVLREVKMSGFPNAWIQELR